MTRPTSSSAAATARPQAPSVAASAGASVAPPRPSPAPPAPPVGPAASTYQVKPGDTLLRIALDHGLSWRDIARWNAIDNPNLIEVGQVLRLVAPASEPAVADARPVAPSGRVDSRPLPSAGPPPSATAPADRPVPAPTATAPGPAPVPAAPSTGAVPAARADASPPPPQPTTTEPAAKDVLEGIDWSWPAQGPVVAAFDDARGVKGLALGGKQGDPVLAAADGRVIYAGSGLRGYGNLVIVRHNSNYLSAYAHNHSLLVKEDQAVRKGQRIAEMGASDADRVKLHFEIRRKGVPVDPARFLPPR